MEDCFTASAGINRKQNLQVSEYGKHAEPEHKTFEGKCLIIVRPKGGQGKIILMAEGEGLTAGEVVIETE